jgi:hypothetical protein
VDFILSGPMDDSPVISASERAFRQQIIWVYLILEFAFYKKRNSPTAHGILKFGQSGLSYREFRTKISAFLELNHFCIRKCPIIGCIAEERFGKATPPMRT